MLRFNVMIKMTKTQQDCFMEMYETFHDRLSKTDLNDYEKVNQTFQTILRSILGKNKGVFSNMPSKNDLLKIYHSLVQSKKLNNDTIIETLLTTRIVRSSSGVLPISIALDGRAPSEIEEGFSCAYNCAFCPNECISNGAEKNIARSYLSSEGTFIRGLIQNFNTTEQVWRRLAELEVMGHVPDKLEIIPLGGTWDCYPQRYRERFAQELFYACNTYSLISIRYNGYYADLLKNWIKTKPFQYNLAFDQAMCDVIRTSRPMRTLDDEKYINTKSNCCRIIGIVFETRPDRISRATLLEKRRLGCTRIQLGIQHTDNKILELNNRGHHVEATVRAIKSCRDNGFKVDGHIMPDLPFTTIDKDYEMIQNVFCGNDLQLDYCKIYPCLDLPFTLARKWKEEGTWKPYAEHNFDQFLKLLCYTLSIIPPWVRINRVQRDFPQANEKNNGLGFVSDTIKTNLHQIVDQEMLRLGLKCYDIRSREVKNTILNKSTLDTSALYIRTYRANEGTEFFISVEIPKDTTFDNTFLLGLCRLRITDYDYNKYKESLGIPAHLLPTYRNKSNKIARIRELHVYGNIASKTTNGNSQHRGIGKFLISIAETISKMYNCNQVSIISGVGVRDYYEKLGYKLNEKEDEFMLKDLNISNNSPNILFGKSFNTKDIQHALLNSNISKKYYSTIDTSSNTSYKTHVYLDIQNGEPQGFLFLGHKPSFLIPKSTFIGFLITMIFFYIYMNI